MANSWIGQTVTLLCKADGVPVPILYWYKPDGTKLNEVKAYESTAVLTMNTEHDFGLYNCTADNGFPLASKMIEVKQISKKNVNKIKTKTVRNCNSERNPKSYHCTHHFTKIFFSW